MIQEFKTKFNVDENAKWSSRNVKALHVKMFKHLEKEAGPTLPLKACIGHWGARLMLQKHWSNVEQGLVRSKKAAARGRYVFLQWISAYH